MADDKRSCLCLIGARGGSCRVPGKNRQEVGGTPLYRNALRAAVESGVCRAVVLTTDDAQILAGGAVPGVVTDERPASLAGDTPSMWDVLGELTERRSELFARGEDIMLLTPCHPLRSPARVREAWELFVSSGAEALVSVTRYPSPPEFRLSLEDGRARRDWTGLVRAAERPVSFYPNGAITIVSQRTFIEHRSPYTGNTAAFEMPWPEGLDIDEPDDLALARRLWDGGFGW